MLYIGIDLGTSAVKLLLMDESGDIKNVVSREYPLYFPHPGWSEQDPDDWYRETLEGLKELLSKEDAGQLAAPLKLMRFLGTPLEAARCVYRVDGTPLEQTVLHPVGLLATVAQGALTVPADSEGYETAKQWVSWFWEQPLRKGVRRYYDNCLYLFALLALSGRYRIY